MFVSIVSRLADVIPTWFKRLGEAGWISPLIPFRFSFLRTLHWCCDTLSVTQRDLFPLVLSCRDVPANSLPPFLIRWRKTHGLRENSFPPGEYLAADSLRYFTNGPPHVFDPPPCLTMAPLIITVALPLTSCSMALISQFSPMVGTRNMRMPVWLPSTSSSTLSGSHAALDLYWHTMGG